MKAVPQFPQGRAIHVYEINARRALSLESQQKMKWAHTQLNSILTLESNHYWHFRVTNFVANPATLKHWLNRAVAQKFPQGDRCLQFKYQGTRKDGMLLVRIQTTDPRNRKVRLGNEITKQV